MTAVASPGINTPQQSPIDSAIPGIQAYSVAANAIIYPGAIVALNTSGYLIQASASSTLLVVGRYDGNETIDNTGGANGDYTAQVRAGSFLYKNSAGGDEVTITAIGDACYVVDDQTVADNSSAGTRPAAGIVAQVTTDGVWVVMGYWLSSMLAESVDSATLSGTNAFTGANSFAGAASLVLPTATVPAQTAEGSIVWDSNDDLLTVGDGAGRKIMVDTTSTQTLTGKSIAATQLTGTVAVANGGTGAATAAAALTALGIRRGTVTLVAGTATVADAATTATTRIVLCPTTVTPGAGDLTVSYSVPTKNAGVSFVVRANVAAGTINNLDVSVLDYIAID